MLAKSTFGRYVNEFTFRLNEGNVKNHTLTRLESLVGAGRRQAPDIRRTDRMKKPKPPKALDAMVAVVLAYRPKPKTKPARKRQRTRRRLEACGRNSTCDRNLAPGRP
jgi:hypothetical protein